MVTELGSYGINLQLTATVKIGNTGQGYQDKLTQIGLLNNNTAVKSCFENTEDDLNDLQKMARNTTNLCLKEFDQNVETLEIDSKYKIDVYATKVQEMVYRFNLCTSTDTNCLDAVAAEITKQIEELPTKILSEVSKANESGDNLKQSTQDCSDQGFAQLIINSDSIILAINSCIENLS